MNVKKTMVDVVRFVRTQFHLSNVYASMVTNWDVMAALVNQVCCHKQKIISIYRVFMIKKIIGV